MSRKLKSHFSASMPLSLRVWSFGDSIAGLSSVADAIVRHVDKVVERAQSPVHVGRLQRQMSVAVERKVERGVGIRGGLMAVVRHKDPYFSFRFIVAMTTICAMIYTQAYSGRLVGAFSDKTGQNVCDLL